jgi:hypothetical protein
MRETPRPWRPAIALRAIGICPGEAYKLWSRRLPSSWAKGAPYSYPLARWQIISRCACLKVVIDKVVHERKVFGGRLFHAWPYAAVALSYLDGFLERFRKAIKVADELFQRLQADGRMRIEAVPHGTNVYTLRVEGANLEKFRAALEKDATVIRKPGKDGSIGLVVNESLNQRSAAELARSFLGALVASK